MTRWTLTFRSEGDGPPVEIRVRRLLKGALRSHGLRCTDIRRTPHPANAGERTEDGAGNGVPLAHDRTRIAMTTDNTPDKVTTKDR